jgi:hypothetical protein
MPAWGEAPHCSSHFQIYVPIEDLVFQSVLLSNPRGEEGTRDEHVFVPVEGGQEVEVLHVKAYVLCPQCADHAVPLELGGRDVGCSFGEFSGVINEIPTCRDSNTVGIVLLGVVVDDYPYVRGGPVFGNIWDAGGEHDKHSIGALLSCRVVSLTHAPNIFSKSCHPGLRGCRVFHEALVAVDEFANDGVDHGHRKVFIVGVTCGLGSQFLGNEMSRWQEIVNQELVDSLLADKATVAYCYSVEPSWGHDGRYNGYRHLA